MPKSQKMCGDTESIGDEEAGGVFQEALNSSHLRFKLRLLFLVLGTFDNWRKASENDCVSGGDALGLAFCCD